MPDGIARKLGAVFTDAMKDPDFIKGMKNLRCTIAYRNSKELEDYVSSNYEAFARLLKEMELTK